MPLESISRLPALSLPSIVFLQNHQRVLLGVGSVTIPIALIVYLKQRLARNSTSTILISPPAQLPIIRAGSYSDRILAVASEVNAAPNDFVLARETIRSLPISLSDFDAEVVFRRTVSRLGEAHGSLLNCYIRATMQAFTWTPQAMIMRWIIKDPAAKQTFDAEYLERCQFQVGDRVNGTYVVRERSDNKVLLDLAAPVGWTGPIVKGCLVIGFELDGENKVKFVNETVLWRRKDEKPNMLEGVFGQWLHGLMVRWIVLQGVKAVTIGRTKT
jgi:hypothetical protein